MTKNNEYFIRKAIDLALKSREQGNEPFGAVLVKDNEIVMSGENQIHSIVDPTHHAEIGLIRKFCSENKIDDLSDYTLYSYRMRNRNAKERYVEILNFQHLTNYVTFTKDGDDFRNKELRNKIEVSVVLDMECVDMLIHD